MKEDIREALRTSHGAIRCRDHPRLAQRLRRLGRRGELVDILPGVWVEPESSTDWRIRLSAGLAWLGPDAVAAGHAAAKLTFWPDCPSGEPAFFVPHDFRARAGWSVTRAEVPPEMLLIRDGTRLTCAAYTAVDLAAGEDGGNVIDRALKSRQATLSQMWAALDAMPSRTGNRERRRLLHDSRDEPWSELEREGHRLLRQHRLTGWRTNAWTPTSGNSGYYTDVLFRRQRVVVEFDGYEFHSSPAAFERDRLRRNELVLAGYTVLNFTWRQVAQDPDWVIDSIRRAIELSDH